METVGLIGHGLIGSKLREALEQQGVNVVVMDKVLPENKSIKSIELDINSEESIQKAIQQLKAWDLKLSCVVNTSYPRTSSYGKKLEDVTVESFNQNVSIHLGGYFNVMKQFGLYFKANGGGSVISFSSVYGFLAPRFDIYDGMTFSMPVEYAAIKAAILNLNGYFAKYFKGSNVRFNSISPGGVFGGHDPQFVKNYGKYALSSRGGMLMPEDLISSVVYLASESSRYINGQNIVVDDGWTL